MNSIKIKLSVIIFTIAVFSFLLYSQHKDGPSFTKDKPPSCFISGSGNTNTGKLCAAAACAMIMKYWANYDVVKIKTCKEWGELFSKFWNSNGGATAQEIKDAFPAIANKHISGKYKFISAHIEIVEAEYLALKRVITFSKEKLDISPWDMPGVLAIGSDKNNSKKRYNKYTQNKHAVTVWGCKKNSKGEIFLKFIDTENKDAVKDKYKRFKQWIKITKKSPYCVFVFLKVFRCQ